MDLKEAIYTRRATREFTAEPVSESIIRDLIDAAIQAPTAVNAQPCTFCVVRDKTVLATISKEAKAYMVRTTPVGLMSHHFDAVLNDVNFDIFYRALPILGRDGTLYNLLPDSPAAGHVHAKTGTFAEYDALNHTLMVTGKGLAGYVDAADGSHLIVAAYVNNVSAPPNFEAVEKVGNALAEIAAAAYAAPAQPAH